MKAAIVPGYGPANVLEVRDVPEPAAGPGQLLVRMHASSLNPLDVKLRGGSLRRLMPLKFPAILGFDLAGVIEGVGSEITGWSLGDRVYGRIDAKTGGAHAELAVVSAAVVDRVPEELSFEEAASLPLVAMTAVQALDQVGLKAGERLLVNGAAGGVGSVAVQIGRAMGASVTGVSSAGGATVVRGLEVPVLVYSKGELARTEERFDVVLDTVFNGPTPDLLRVLDRRGRYVSTGFSPRLLLRRVLGPLRSRKRFGFVMSRADGGLMRRVSELAAAGRLEPVITGSYPLAQIAEAHARLDRGHVHGKIVISIP